MNKKQVTNMINEVITSNFIQNKNINHLIRNVFNCNGNVICSPEDSIDPNWDLEMAKMTNSHTSFVSMFDWRAWAAKITLVIFIIWIFWRAALQWCLKIINLLCNPRMRLTLCQTIKVFFSSIDEAFNPLSLTRAEFKQKITKMENELEAIRATANRLESLINRLEAEGNSIPPNITFLSSGKINYPFFHIIIDKQKRWQTFKPSPPHGVQWCQD